ncbi:MAG: ATP synthase subunit B/B' [Candidatus Nanopelagicaceae bacterium]|jgi:dsDNA-specific endonuclease/ATPase MutS2
MDAVEKLASAIKMVEEARGVPLSASCVVHRGEMLGVLDEAKAALPESFAKAESILANRDKVIDEGRMQAEQMVAMAREEASQLIEQTAIMQQAREEAKNILAQARNEAAEQRAEIEEYIDSRLATLEVILNKTQEAITRGRERLAGSTDKDVLSQLSE